MTSRRAEDVWAHVADLAADRGGDISLSDVCAAAVSLLQASGAWVVIGGTMAVDDHFMCATGDVSARLAEAQLMLGEGPGYDKPGSDEPVLVPDLAAPEAVRRWPAFTAAARRAGAAAMFAFPFRIGSGTVSSGALVLYRAVTGSLAAPQLEDGRVLAGLAATLLLGSEGYPEEGQAPAGDMGHAPDLVLLRAEIDQAIGMISEQLGVPAGEAAIRLSALAHAQHRPLSEVAGDVVAHRLRFSAGSDPPESGQ